VAGLATSLGAGAASNSFNQIEHANTLFIIGSNTTEAHPIVSLHVKKALRRGAKLIVADPRRIELVKWADVWLNQRPGTNIALMNGLIHIILKEGWEDKEFIKNRTEGFDELKAKVQEYTPERVEKITGVSKEKLWKAAKLYAKAEKGMILYGLGISEHRSGTEGAMAIANLALVCGHFGKDSTGVNTLRGQNNVQGASDFALPYVLPGYQQLNDPLVRAKFEKTWGVPISPQKGLTSVDMYNKAIEKKFKGLYILGEDPAQTDTNVNKIRKALKSLEFLVVHDIFHTETTKYAHVILPGASFAEKDGTFTNGERRVQRVRKAIEPIAGMAEWEVITRLANLMGYPMKYNHPSEIMDEIASLVPIYGGISYERLEHESLQWPCPTKDHPGTKTLYTDQFLRPGGKAKFVPLDHVGPGETADKEYPFILITGRIREHYNNGSMTRRSSGIREIVPEESLEINPSDAKKLGINSGDIVTLSSRRAKIRVKAKVTDRVQEGNLFMTFHFPDALSNFLTSEHRDPITGTPEYKVTAVRIDK
jgi:formate dehydrogenase alpha subunit